MEGSAAMIRLVATVIEWAIAALFVYAGAVKVLEPAAFAIDVHNYRLLPWPISVAVALYLPWLEIVAGTALVFRRPRTAALLIFTVLMLGFIAALISAKLRGIDIACGCFGAGGKTGGFWLTLLRDAALLAALLFTLRFGRAHTAGDAAPM
jgi:putative oxidoreductase